MVVIIVLRHTWDPVRLLDLYGGTDMISRPRTRICGQDSVDRSEHGWGHSGQTWEVPHGPLWRQVPQPEPDQELLVQLRGWDKDAAPLFKNVNDVAAKNEIVLFNVVVFFCVAASDFHRCQKALEGKGADTAPCEWYRRVYKSLCPMAWVRCALADFYSYEKMSPPCPRGPCLFSRSQDNFIGPSSSCASF